MTPWKVYKNEVHESRQRVPLYMLSRNTGSEAAPIVSSVSGLDGVES